MSIIKITLERKPGAVCPELMGYLWALRDAKEWSSAKDYYRCLTMEDVHVKQRPAHEGYDVNKYPHWWVNEHQQDWEADKIVGIEIVIPLCPRYYSNTFSETILNTLTYGSDRDRLWDKKVELVD